MTFIFTDFYILQNRPRLMIFSITHVLEVPALIYCHVKLQNCSGLLKGKTERLFMTGINSLLTLLLIMM